ncbi:discoidin domain-containing protein [Dickeya zeae]|uniref:discoidin domain-containing protein n=1 Tax=Dickeya zeae TaxID=204042 RepID=UPI001C62F756|nr:discoidin domain-containing protein [Dickeya zeae]
MADEITIPPVESLPSITEADEFSDVKLLPYGIRARGYDGQAIGPANYQAQALANRTHYLKTRLDSIGTPIKSVFGRTTQAITAQTGDYTAEQIAETAGKRFVTPTDVQAWNAKLSASSVSTLNGKSLTAGGNVTLSDIGASPVAHQHAASEITGLLTAINAALLPGSGVTITQDNNGRSVISATSSGGVFGGQFTVVTRNIATLSPATFYLSDQTSFAFAAYALKEEAGSTATITTDSYDDVTAYNKTPGLIFDGLVHQYNGETYLLADAGSGIYSKQIALSGSSIKLTGAAVSVVPAMTTDTSPTGYIASASSLSTSGGSSTPWRAFYAFDGLVPNTNGNDCWASGAGPTTAAPQWLAIQLPAAAPVKSYSITNRYQYGNSPAAWKLQGCNDGATWTDLHSVSNDINNNAAAVRTYTLPATAFYSNYRLLITAAATTSSYVSVAELKLYSPAGKLILQSGGKYYSVNGGALTEITSSITPAVIDSVGVSSSGQISVSSLTAPVSAISNDILYVKTTCFQPSQIAIPKQTVSVKSWNAITSASVTSTQSGSGAIRFAVSRNLTEWFVFSSGSWVSVGALTPDTSGASKLLSQGMTTATLAGVTAAQWVTFYSDTLDSIAFAVAIDVPNPEADSATIDTVSLSVSASAWKLQTPAEVEIRWYRDRVIFKPATTGNYKFAYQQPQQ